MNYSKDFIDAVGRAKSENFYLGTGNPNSKVLIIGKENAHDENSDRDKSARGEIDTWLENINSGADASALPDSFFDHDLLNPLYPFKGQRNMINNNKNGGTSRTWFNYQKLYDNIFTKGVKSEGINFHEHAFITELNDNPSSYSHLQDKERRQASVDAKCKFFKDSAFFQGFPVVILACSHYPRELGIDIINLFNAEFKGKTDHADNDTRQWYNIHYNKQSDSPKLVIHTRQLSMNIKDALLKEIAAVVKEFSIRNKIKLI